MRTLYKNTLVVVIIILMILTPLMGAIQVNEWGVYREPNTNQENALIYEGETGLLDWAHYSSGLINVISGNLFLSQSDILVPAKAFDIEFVRSYNSHHRDIIGPLGRGWTHNYNMNLILNPDGSVVFLDWDGSTANFTDLGVGQYLTPPGTNSRLSFDGSNYTIFTIDGNSMVFDSAGVLQSIEDKNLNTLSFEYGASGLEKIQDSVGQNITFAYGPSDTISSITDSSGRSVQFTYDAAAGEALETVTGTTGNVTHYGYFSSTPGLIKFMVDTSSRVLEFNYTNDLGKLKADHIGNSIFNSTTKTYPPAYEICSVAYDSPNQRAVESIRGYSYEIYYDAQGRILNRTGPLGRVTEYSWSAENQLLSLSKPGNINHTYSYGAYGNLISETGPMNYTDYYLWDIIDEPGTYQILLREHKDARGITYTYSYDSRGNMLTSSTSGETTSYAYYSDGLMKNSTSAAGNVIEYEYSASGWVSNITYPDGNVSSFQRDSLGRAVNITNVMGDKYGLSYDGANRLVSIVYPDGNQSSLTYDQAGNVLSTQKPDGSIDQYSLNFMNMPQNANISGAETDYNYDRHGNLIKQVNPEGQTTLYEYDEAGRLVKVRGPANFTQEIVYDAADNVIAFKNKNEHWSYFEYDPMGRMIRHTNPAGESTHYSYDSNGNLLYEKDPMGNSIHYTYDQLGRLCQVIDQTHNSTIIKYNSMGKISNITDASGAITEYIYDPMGRPVEIQDAMGNSTHFEYDASGNLLRETNALGSIEYDYDPMGRLRNITDPTGNISHYDYDAFGRAISQTDPLGRVIEYNYNQLGNIINITGPGTNSTLYDYDDLGHLVSVTDPSGSVIEMHYDAVGNMEESVDSGGNSTSYTYDGMGNLLTITDPLGRTWSNEYDAAGRLICQADPNGKRAFYNYDAAGRLSSTRDRNGFYTFYERDAAGRVVRETDDSGHSTEYSYDAVGNLISMTDPRGNTLSYEYDLLGRVIAMEDAAGNETFYDYDEVGNLVMVEQPNGAVTEYEYDPLSRLVNATDALDNTTRYFYNPVGQVQGIVDAAGGATVFNYDQDGRLACILEADGNETFFSYDSRGLLVQVEDALGGIEGYAYNLDGLLTEVTAKDGNSTIIGHNPAGEMISIMDPLGETIYLDYDDNGRLASVTNLYYSVYLDYDGQGNLVAYTDGKGHQTEYEYNQRGQVIWKLAPNGDETIYTYDGVGNLESVQFDTGSVVHMTYDALNRLSTVTDPMGNSTIYDYDEVGNLASATDRRGFTTLYGYDLLGRLISVTYALGNTSHYDYGPMGNLLNYTDARGSMTIYDYDIMGRVTDIVDALGNRTEYQYDNIGRVTAERATSGFWTHYQYDAMDRIINITYPDGNSSLYSYDAVGNVLTSTDPGGNMYEYYYDHIYRLINYTDPTGNKSFYGYDNNDNVISFQDPNGETSTYQYDNLNRLERLEDALGNLTLMVYDPLDNVELYTDRTGEEWTYTYDLNGRLVQETDPLGNDTYYVFDHEGNLINKTDKNGNSCLYNYDPLGRMVESICPYGYSTLYSYDENGNLVEKEDALGNISTYSYDPLDRLVKYKDKIGAVTNFTYDANGNLMNVTNPRGYSTTFFYDSLDRVTGMELANGVTEEYGYDANGNMVSMLDGEGNISTYEYDSLDRLIKRGFADGETFLYDYDANGNLVHASREYGPGNITIDYDELNRPILKTTDYGPFLKDIEMDYDEEGRLTGFLILQDGWFTEYTRDELGHLVSIFDMSGYTNLTYDAGGRNTEIQFAGGSSTYKAWNDANLIQNVTNMDSSSTVVSWFNYTYNQVGWVTDVESKKGQTVYDYNQNGWVTNVSGPDGFYNYSWDANGNMIGYQFNSLPIVASVYDPVDQLKSRGGIFYDYDENGRRRKNDENGDLTNFTYDWDNKLKRIEFETNVTTYIYDAMGERIYTDNGSSQKAFINLLDKTIMETDITGNPTSTFTFGDVIDEPYVLEQAGVYYSYAFDGAGNVVSVLDQAGAAAAEYTYSVFGETSSTGNLDNPFCYEGRYYNPDYEFYDYRARAYDPETAQFMTMDPRGFESEYNLYQFCRNNPIRFDDPYGTIIYGNDDRADRYDASPRTEQSLIDSTMVLLPCSESSSSTKPTHGSSGGKRTESSDNSGDDSCSREFETVEECLACVKAWEDRMLEDLIDPATLDQELEEHKAFMKDQEARHQRHMARIKQGMADSYKQLRDSLAKFGAAEDSLKSLDSAIDFLGKASQVISIGSTMASASGKGLAKLGKGLQDVGVDELKGQAKTGGAELVGNEVDHLTGNAKSGGKGGMTSKGLKRAASNLDNVDTDKLRETADALTDKAKQAAGISERKKSPGDIIQGLAGALDTVLGAASPSGALTLPLQMLQQFFECWKPGQQVRMADALYAIAGAIDHIRYSINALAEYQEARDKQRAEEEAELALMRRENREAKEHWNMIKNTAANMRALCEKEKRGSRPVPTPDPNIPPGKPAVTLGGAVNMQNPGGGNKGKGAIPAKPQGFFGPGAQVTHMGAQNRGNVIMPPVPMGPDNLILLLKQAVTYMGARNQEKAILPPTPPSPENIDWEKILRGEVTETAPDNIEWPEFYPPGGLLPWGNDDIFQPHPPIYFPSPDDLGLVNLSIEDGDIVLPGSDAISLGVENYGDTPSSPGNVGLDLYKWGTIETVNEGFETGIVPPWLTDPPGQWVDGFLPRTGAFSAQLLPGAMFDSALIYDMPLDIQNMENPMLSFWFTTSGPLEPVMIDIRASVNGGIAAPDFTEYLYTLDTFIDPGNFYVEPVEIDLSPLSGFDNVRLGLFAMMPPMMSEFHIDDFVITEEGWEMVATHSEPVPEIGPGEEYTVAFPSYTFEDGEEYMAVYSLSPEDDIGENNYAVTRFECGEFGDVGVFDLIVETSNEEPPLDHSQNRTMQATIVNLGNGLADPVDINAHLGQSQELFYDEIEDGDAMWSMIPPTSNWNIMESGYTPPNSWACTLDGMVYDINWHESLTMNPVDLSDPNLDTVQLSFMHAYDLEMTNGQPVDGANIKISTDGIMWDVISPAGGYDGTIPITGGNPMGDQEAFSGIEDYGQEFVDLTPYIGNPEVYVRFDMGTDESFSMNSGWFIDDVEVSGLIELQTIPVSTPIISLPGSQSGDVYQVVETQPFSFPGPGEWTLWMDASIPEDDYFPNNLAMTKAVAYTAYEIPLALGWNFVSLPFVQFDTSLGEVLSSIEGQWDMVKYYDSGQWLSANVQVPGNLNTLNSIDHEMGFWIHINQDNVALMVNGYSAGETDIHLTAGWNLVGYPSFTGRLASNSLAGTGADIVAVYNGASPYLVQDFTDLSAVSMSPGNAYWVHVPSDAVWTVVP